MNDLWRWHRGLVWGHQGSDKEAQLNTPVAASQVNDAFLTH